MSLLRRRMMGLSQNKNVIGNQPIGTTVKIKIDDTYWDFFIVHQGNPNPNLYDASCNGTWMMMNLIHSRQMWGQGSRYDTSNSEYWLRKTLFPKVDKNVKPYILSVKIPYSSFDYDSQSATVYSGSNGLTCNMFLPAAYELGWTNSYMPTMVEDGACLEYFKGFDDIDSRRIARLPDGSRYWYWTRTISTDADNSVWAVVSINGDCTPWTGIASHGQRPMMIFNKKTPMDVFY